MSTPFPSEILLATDGSPDAALAATAAADLAARSGSKLHLVHAWRPLPHYAYPSLLPERYYPPYEKGARVVLEEQLRVVAEVGEIPVEPHLVAGRPADAVLGLAEELGAGLIGVGSRGRLPRLLLGSVSEEVVHRATCPVLVVRGGQEAWPPDSIVLGDDGSLESAEAGELAARFGRLFGAEGYLVHAYPALPAFSETEEALDTRAVSEVFRGAEESLRERAAGLERVLGRRLEVRAAVGDAAGLILGVARDASPALVAVGSRGLGIQEDLRGGFARLGSVSTKVVRAASGPVLVCPRRTPQNGSG
jgi:nucleotide-binding universal stress UspA family protein